MGPIHVTQGKKDSWCIKFKSFCFCRANNKTSDLVSEDTDREEGGGNTNINPEINTMRTISTKRGEEMDDSDSWSTKELIETKEDQIQRHS